MEFTINQLAALLEGEVHGDGTAKVNKVSTLETAQTGSISFLHNPQYEALIYTTKASAVIVGQDLELSAPIEPALIKVADPYNSLTTLLQEYEKITQAQLIGVEEPAYLGAGSTTGENCYRAAFSYVGKNVQIGSGVKIHAHASIGDGCTIGDHTVIHAGAKLYPKTVVGAHCVIHSGAVIGSDGFGFAPQSDGSYRPIPQVGNVILEDHVSIGANTTIDCATLDSTIIREGVKLDNLIQVAHNVEIGAHTAVAAQTGISGSAKIGKHCIIAGQVGIVGHLTIADRVTVGAQAGIGKSIKKEGVILLGSPAFEIGPYKRAYALFRNLPKIADRVNELEKKVLNLPAK